MKEQFGWIKRMLGAEGAQDENAEVLRRMKADGDDPEVPRDIDFHHLFGNEDDAIAFRAKAGIEGYRKTDHDFWEEEGRWLTTVHVTMRPELEEITRIEQDLNSMATPLNGEPDGWGCIEVEKKEIS